MPHDSRTRRHGSSSTWKVTFLPENRDVEVEAGTTVHEAAREARVPLVAYCGSRGRCGRCVVEVEGEAPPPTKTEIELLEGSDLAAGRRLACELKVEGDMEVRLPESGRAVFTEILSDGECVAFPLDAEVTVHEVELAEPSLEDNIADLSRLARGLGRDISSGEIEAARSLPSILRENGFRARVLLRGDKLVRAASPSDGLRALGAAFDIGTTTVAGSVLDLATGEQLGVASRTNPQHALGDDVVSRMDYAARGPEPLADLHSRIAGCLNEMLEELAAKAGGTVDEIHDIVVAGNNVMTHLFLRLPPEAMATVPFAPVVTCGVNVAAREVGLRASPHAHVWTTPSVSAYVGGDVVAGVLAVGFSGFSDEAIFIDIGTNGEVVAGSSERAVCAATAAGPAFEGARISCGMRAVPGAVTHVKLEDGRLRCDVVGGARPAGLCGTGLVDAVACLLKAGVIDETGRIDPDSESGLARGVRDGKNGPEIVLWDGDGGEIVLTQRDVRELQLAKGAICAGANVLLDELGTEAADVRSVLLAGAFGSTIDPESAVAIGLLPAGITPERVRAVGNTAAAGARASLMSRSARREASRLARWVRPVELSLHPRFQELFAEAMIFPSSG